jgi:hypothetical protein
MSGWLVGQLSVSETYSIDDRMIRGWKLAEETEILAETLLQSPSVQKTIGTIRAGIEPKPSQWETGGQLYEKYTFQRNTVKLRKV